MHDARARRLRACGAAAVVFLLTGCEAARLTTNFRRDPDSGVARGAAHLLVLPDALPVAPAGGATPDALLQAALQECRPPDARPPAQALATVGTLLLGGIAQLGVSLLAEQTQARIDSLREHASATYGAEIVLSGAQWRRARCIVFQRELAGRPAGAFRADAGTGLLAVFRIKPYLVTVAVEPRPAAPARAAAAAPVAGRPAVPSVVPPPAPPAPTTRQEAVAFQLEPIYVRLNRAVAWTAPTCIHDAADGPGPDGACVDLSIAFAFKPLVREANRYVPGEARAAALAIDGLRLGRATLAACETTSPAAEAGCRNVDVIGRLNTALVPMPADDDLPLSVAVAVSEAGRVGIRLDRARVQLEALATVLGPLAKDVVTEATRRQGN